MDEIRYTNQSDMVKRYNHQKRGSDDDTVALTAIDTEQQSQSSLNSEPEYEYKNVKWKDFVTKKKYIRMCAEVVLWGILLMRI